MTGAFRARFGDSAEIRIFRAPGRVNLIGEHTDYNLGFVMPMALHLATWIAAAPNTDGRLRIYSEGQKELCEWPVEAIGSLQRRRHWTDYPIGVAQQLLRAGFPIAPANLLIRSTVPEGSGLSSSAALEVSTALALLRGREIAPLDLARLCQRAEREFVGMPCGIMDQYISVSGRKNAAVEIDCRSLQNRVAKLPDGIAFAAVNSMVKHELSGSAYKERTEECAAAVEILRNRFPAVESLRDATLQQLAAVEAAMPPVVVRRARHVITEDARVERFVEASTTRDLPQMGRLLVESHRSLQRDYEVSCEELDFLVDTALGIGGVIGSRMTGGGFGGCTVTMLRAAAVESFTERIAAAYREKYAITPNIILCRPSDGAGEDKNS
jgi:galactokinase